MGAGKTTIARALRLPHVETDADVPSELFEQGEEAFRAREAEVVREVLGRADPLVVDLGGGAVTTPEVRGLLEERATVVWIDVDVETAWQRVEGSGRPLARNFADFERLYEERRPIYAEVADVVAHDLDDVVLAVAGVHVERGALARLGELVPGEEAVALVSDPNVAGIHGMDAQLALGGGCTTDAAGFVAATYLRGIAWTPVPTSLVAQVDAAIGGKTAIDLPQGKNLVGAFHWPARTVVDPALLETLPEPQRLEGMAEVVKAGLLAGEPFWELPDEALVRRSIAYKAAICLRDPHERGGERTILNLGHTFAHALEVAAGYDGLTHGRAVALGLLAALRLSGRDTDVVEEVLRPKPVRVDRERAWEAMKRDKKARGGVPHLVLLGDEGPVGGVVLPEADVRRELDRLIA
jgi:shikimate kinase